ncbi:MAG: alpha-amylase, partial [Lysobacterales bacterium CG_4_9_14_3_um_filter_62_6]
MEIYQDWISRYRIDGFRVDTAKHVDDAFWRHFIPAILAHARAVGIPDFYLFGEAYALTPKALGR